jgi:D-alanyl-D-alanine carboxypeptidase
MLTGHRPSLFRWAFFALFSLQSALAAATPSLVIEADTGRVLEAQDIFVRWRPASLTKLMTAYVAFREIEAGNLTMKSPVRVSLAAARMPPSHMAYPIGTVVTLDNALKMLIVKSANDIAVAIAESVSGSVEEFANRMNAEARRIGMSDTNFVNPNGLHDEAQFTTARDLAILARTIRREFPQYARYFSTEAIATEDRVYPAYNLLLGRFAGADGMKTGYVCESGFNLAASATRGDRTLIAIVLGAFSSNKRAEEAARLLDAGFKATSAASGRPLLQVMQKPDGLPSAAADLRPVVCSDEARQQRAQERREIYETALLKPLEREPVAVRVGPGGAVGSSRSAAMLLGRMVQQIPVPAEKPIRISLASEEDKLRYALKPGEVPKPQPRPEPEAG